MGNAVQNLDTFLMKLIDNGKFLLATLTIGAIVIGAILQITNGRDGLERAKKWYIGGLVGFTIGMLANPLVQMFKENMMF